MTASSTSQLLQTDTTFIEVLRESEFTNDVDYLMNHNSGDIDGDAGFLTMTSKSPDGKSFLNVSFVNATFTLYCVELMKAKLPSSKTPEGNHAFADYLSCNDNGDAKNPQCTCDNVIDRSVANQLPTPDCLMPNGTQCTASSMKSLHDCHCRCTDLSTELSAKYTGMMPVKLGQPQSIGVWYSHPQATECAQNEAIGQLKQDGSTICTWKRHPLARTVKGFQVLKNGWSFPTSRSPTRADPAQVKHNGDVIRQTINSAPLQPRQCGAQTASPVIIV
eukprot:gnl/MRDRNA2_/MRDRNA2_14288_c0_seq1.p1 gnl/MRDRNA2_/MRDRNA2_14288_c0~~gnl/MRDRNA2_/MRDRNA2_14288_c0_seq1.p1  ORF type:complete len:309 (-),score=33.87 gnl/MRDRNA2_/MRDRNA2_14288_c0_seq1:88-915(-)